MIILKTHKELEKMREAGLIAARALKLAGEAVEPGISTLEIEQLIKNYILNCGAKPSFLGYHGYPAASCISINDVVVHGIPSQNCKLKQGDIVSIDVGALLAGFHGDTAATFACGDISPPAQALIDATKQSLYEGINQARNGNRIGDISNAVQSYIEARGYSAVRDFVGHGVGRELHEDPSVPNFGLPGRGERLQAGVTIAIEPMINMGKYGVISLPDKWTIKTADGSLSAHFEHTIAITNDEEPLILTLPD